MTAPTPGTTVAKKTKKELLTDTFRTEWAPEIEGFASHSFTAERVLSALLVAAVHNPTLFSCTKSSLQLAIMKCARWRLDIGDGVHLIPFKKNVAAKGEPASYVMVCEAVPDYRGLVALAQRQRIVRTIEAYPVYEGDDFDYQLGLHAYLKHRPCAEAARKKLRGAYIVILLPGGIERFHYLPVEDIDRRRANSKSWSPKQGFAQCPPWYAMKTVIRDWLNRQPKSGALAEAVAVDDAEVVEVDPETGEVKTAIESTAGFTALPPGPNGQGHAKPGVRQPPEETFLPLEEQTEADLDLDRRLAAEDALAEEEGRA